MSATSIHERSTATETLPYGSVSVAVDRSWMLVALMYPVVGAVLGWLSAVAAIRFGWKLSRADS
ncbi:hypothetical protein GS482_30200 [Rhodococcus hoagii]|nr:hypothetical protein [Prescottella equi]